MKLQDIKNIDLLRSIENATEIRRLNKYKPVSYLKDYIGLHTHRSYFYGRFFPKGDVKSLQLVDTLFTSPEDITLLIEGIVILDLIPANTGDGNISYVGYGVLEVNGAVVYDGRNSGVSSEALSSVDTGIEFTGGFAGKPLSNNYVWENGAGISITTQDVTDGIYKTFSMDSTVQVAVDSPYWTDPTPADHTGKGVFGGSYLPEGVITVFDYTTVDSDTYEDGTNVVTTGGLDFSQLQVGDKVDVRFDFNAIPQIANTTIEPAIWYKNRDASDNVTFTFPLTAQPIFYGTGTVGKSYLNRVSLTIYIASQEDINSLSHFAIKSDNLITIQPLSALFTLLR